MQQRKSYNPIAIPTSSMIETVNITSLLLLSAGTLETFSYWWILTRISFTTFSLSFLQHLHLAIKIPECPLRKSCLFSVGILPFHCNTALLSGIDFVFLFSIFAPPIDMVGTDCDRRSLIKRFSLDRALRNTSSSIFTMATLFQLLPLESSHCHNHKLLRGKTKLYWAAGDKKWYCKGSLLQFLHIISKKLQHAYLYYRSMKSDVNLPRLHIWLQNLWGGCAGQVNVNLFKNI